MKANKFTVVSLKIIVKISIFRLIRHIWLVCFWSQGINFVMIIKRHYLKMIKTIHTNQHKRPYPGLGSRHIPLGWVIFSLTSTILFSPLSLATSIVFNLESSQ